MAIRPPDVADGTVLSEVVDTAASPAGPGSVEKCLIYAPDAIGAQLWQLDGGTFGPVLEHAPIRVLLRSVVPPKTPVCFASMFTGAPPQVHGIRSYTKPVLTCETLFDAAVRAGKRVAIVAVKDSSIDRIFRKRKIDYFSEPDDLAVTARTLELLKTDGHDLIVVYHCQYDDTLHRETPFSPNAIQAVRNHIASFRTIAESVREQWQNQPHAVVFAPDHGAHIDSAGVGTHGEDIPDDMLVYHCFGLNRSSRGA
jgi:predicted AlkP superfamily pyrophosphatase or phosphodiesterase